MMWVLLGVIAGTGWVLAGQAQPWLVAPLDGLLSVLSHAGSAMTHALVRGLGLGAGSPLADAVAALAAVLAPGVVCLLLAEAVAASRSARNAAALLLTGVAFASFLWLPGPEALGLVIVTLVLDVLLAFTHGLILVLPVTTVITALAGRQLVEVLEGADRFAVSAQTLSVVGGDAGLWRMGLAVAALVAGFGAVSLLTRSR